ncbi:MAG: hypothetical protein SF123_08125 [Chloroflexota bacterium]|nr:hypothetical protein [Chloroflexota bacterium]
MAQDARAQLVEAYNLIKAGRKSDAEALLIKVLQRDERNADAWWLMANALTQPDEQREALEMVLQLRAGDEKARKMLDKINALHPPPKPQPQEDKSFADLLAGDDDPFAELDAPPQRRPTSSDPFADDDPFAAPKADLKPRMSSSPFGDDDDPFAEPTPKRKSTTAASASRPSASTNFFEDVDAKQKRIQSSRKSSPWTTIAIIVGVLALVGCGACIFIIFQFQQGVTQVLNDPTLQAAFNDPTLQAVLAQSGSGSSFAPSGLPSGLNDEGRIEPGQTVNGTLDDDLGDNSYTFSAIRGTRYRIDLIATDDDIDPRVAVYGPNGQLIGANDDIDLSGGNTNSRLDFEATESGRYTIVVGQFGFGNGGYELEVEQR